MQSLPQEAYTALDSIIDDLARAFSGELAPHYREDYVKGKLALIALERGHALAEPRRGGKSTPDSIKVHLHRWSSESGYTAEHGSTPKRATGKKPDIRIVLSNEITLVGEIKAGMARTSSDANCNVDRVKTDLASLESGQCDFFLGVFDHVSLGRIRHNRDIARVLPSHLLEHYALSQPTVGTVSLTSDGPPLRSRGIPVRCRSRIPLLLFLLTHSPHSVDTSPST